MPEAFDSGYSSGDSIRELKKEWEITGQVINGYIRFIQSQINLQSRGKPNDTVEESEMPYQTQKDHPAENDSIDNLLDEPI